MAAVNFTSLYQWVGYPTYNWILQSTPYAATAKEISYVFPGPQAGGPIKLRVLPATTGSFSFTLNVGTSFSDLYNTFKDFSVSVTAGVWAEFEMSSAQQAIANANSSIYVYLSSYSEVYFYTSGSNAAHLLVPDPYSIRVKVGGTWKSGKPYIKVGGVWKEGEAWIKVGGVWKKGS